jgi:hypothetical protein
MLLLNKIEFLTGLAGLPPFPSLSKVGLRNRAKPIDPLLSRRRNSIF